MRPDGAYERARLNMAGEALLIVEFGTKLTPQINDAVLAFDQSLQDNALVGCCESAPAGRSVMLRFDPLAIAPEKFRTVVSERLALVDWFHQPRSVAPAHWHLPVCYGGSAGPDLAVLAELLNKPVDEIIKAHGSLVQRVFMIGFAPGFLYTGMAHPLFEVPRLATIKPLVPAGSVSVAVGQTVISSTPHSTGWYTIGRTPFRNFDLAHKPVFTIKAGDEISFYEIGSAELTRLQAQTGRGLVRLEATDRCI